MYAGYPTLCLPAKDLEAFERLPDARVVLRRGALRLAHDPEGNAVFFDTNRNEDAPEHKPRRIADLLRSTEREPVDAGAECLRAFRTEVLAKYAARAG